MNKLWTILILLLILIGLSYMLPFNKQPKILETRNFSCEGMTGFTFKYPVFEGWEVKEIQKTGEDKCTVFLIDSYVEPDNGKTPSDVIINPFAAPRIEVATKAIIDVLPRLNKENPQGIPYEEIMERVYGYAEGDETKLIHFEEKRGIRFCGKDYCVSIELFGVLSDHGFSKEEFWKTVIESFIITNR